MNISNRGVKTAKNDESRVEQECNRIHKIDLAEPGQCIKQINKMLWTLILTYRAFLYGANNFAGGTGTYAHSTANSVK